MAGAVHDGVPAHVRVLPSLADALIADPVQSEAAMLRADELEVLREPRVKIGHVRGPPRLQANERSAVHGLKPVFQIGQFLTRRNTTRGSEAHALWLEQEEAGKRTSWRSKSW